MTTTTQEKAEVQLATPGQVRHILTGLIPKDLTFDRAKFLGESGVLTDVLEMDLEIFDRDKFCLANGVQPYSVIDCPKFTVPFYSYTIDQFRVHLAENNVVFKIHSSDELAFNDLESSNCLVDGTASFSLIRLKRHMPQETLLSFLQRDRYQPASIGELLWVIRCDRTSLSRSVIWSIGSGISLHSEQVYPKIQVRDPDEDECRLSLQAYSTQSIHAIGKGAQILVKNVS